MEKRCQHAFFGRWCGNCRKSRAQPTQQAMSASLGSLIGHSCPAQRTRDLLSPVTVATIQDTRCVVAEVVTKIFNISSPLESPRIDAGVGTDQRDSIGFEEAFEVIASDLKTSYIPEGGSRQWIRYRYEAEGVEVYWWGCVLDENDFFVENTTGPWRCYKCPESLRVYWYNCDTEECFFAT